MKNEVVYRSIVLGIIVLFVGVSVIPSTVGIINEKTGFTNFTSRGYIQGLIDNASDGDTIFIPNGTYHEHIVIDKSITLIGEDKNTTIIDGSGEGNVISIVSDWVNINGFTIRYSDWIYGAGIIINSCYTNITNNIITHNGCGIVLYEDSDYNNIINNCITNNWDGIVLWGDNNTISGNTITKNDDGINLWESRNNTIVDNILLDNYNEGIVLSRSDDNVIHNNTISNNDVSLYENSCNNIISNNSFFNTGFVISDDNVCNNIVMNNTVNGKPLVYVYDESDLILGGDAGQIILINCTNITAQNQNIFNTTVGILLLGSNTCVISGNTIARNNKDGISLAWGDHNKIINNTIINNENGVYFGGSNNNTISGNTIKNNNNVGIHLSGSSNTISDNTITNHDDGINLSGDRNTISGNTITKNDDGIRLDEHSNHNHITNNNISHNSDGIYLYYSQNNTISDNTITNNENGTRLSNDIGSNTISGNTITNNSDGIYLSSDLNNIINNSISHNGDGIYLDWSDHNNIINNTIINNENGVYLWGSYNSTISGNTITNNNCGIRLLAASSKNIIYHNNFINIDQNAYDPNENTWYNTELYEGNYWSDYTGNDLNGDGIGDIPYVIPGGSNQDLYPFMEPEGWLKEPEFQKAFIFGRITNLVTTGKYITFEAVKTRVLSFRPFSFNKYVSGETCIISKDSDYRGLIGIRYIFVLCEIAIKI